MNQQTESDAEGQEDRPPEIALVGDLSEHESDLCDKLLSVPLGGACALYFNCPGGSAYSAISVMNLIVLRGLHVTGIVTGECSSAALWPLAACVRRIVTPYSVLLFHPMKWQSEENVHWAEATEWARHFGDLEKTMDQVLARLFGIEETRLRTWMRPGTYVTGPELAKAGLAELVGLDELRDLWREEP